jgi:hypothetical protein
MTLVHSVTRLDEISPFGKKLNHKKLLKVNTHWAKMGENSSNLATLPNKHDFGEK